MTFLTPWAAWFLAGIPVIVLLYLLKLKRRPVAVSTLMFWQRVMQESRRRALFQRLRNLFSLLLHLLILGFGAWLTFHKHITIGTLVSGDHNFFRLLKKNFDRGNKLYLEALIHRR